MLTTPNLFNKFFPCPKPAKRVKASPKPLGAGKRTKEWNTAREELKKEFDKAGINTCEARFENCWKNTALGFAHPAKRRELKKGEMKVVILVCSPCHHILDYEMSHEEMRDFIEAIIKSRKVKI